MGTLAVDNRYKVRGMGEMGLIDALRRSYEISKSIGSFAFVVDTLDEDGEWVYTKYGFILLPDIGKMFLPMNTIGRLFEEKRTIYSPG